MFFCYLSFYVFVRNYTRYRTFHDIRYRSRILSDSSYLRTVTPESRQTTDPNLFDKGADSCGCWRPDDTDLPSQNANGPYEWPSPRSVCACLIYLCGSCSRSHHHLHLNEPFHEVVSMQQLAWPSDVGMTRCWQTCVTGVKRVSYPVHQTRGQSWDW